MWDGGGELSSFSNPFNHVLKAFSCCEVEKSFSCSTTSFNKYSILLLHIETTFFNVTWLLSCYVKWKCVKWNQINNSIQFDRRLWAFEFLLFLGAAVEIAECVGISKKSLYMKFNCFMYFSLFDIVQVLFTISNFGVSYRPVSIFHTIIQTIDDGKSRDAWELLILPFFWVKNNLFYVSSHLIYE